jgi:hypothetical protein
MAKEQTIGQQLRQAIVGFPRYISTWMLGLIVAIISDYHITTLTLTGVAVGFATGSVLIGLASFFVIYAFSRSLSNIADGVAYSASLLGSSVERAANHHAQITGSPVIKEE